MMLSWIHAMRSSRVLDDRKPGIATRDQSVVHALLSAKDQAPLEPAPEYLRRRIVNHIEDTTPTPVTASDAWAQALRRLAVPIIALVGLSACVIAWQSMRTTPRSTNLPSIIEVVQADDDPDPDITAPSVPLRQSATYAQNSERWSGGVAVVLPRPPSDAIGMKRDAEGFIRGVIQTLPIRQDEPR